MFHRSLIVFLALGASFFATQAYAAPGSITYAKLNCDGTAVVRTDVGQLDMVSVEKNMPGCVGGTATSESATSKTIGKTSSGEVTKVYDATKNGPLLDITSEQIGQYRINLMKEQGIKYANPIRSVRMRSIPSKVAKTTAYLMKNDAVVVSQSGTGWTKAYGAEVKLLDPTENVVAPATYGKAKGYVATKFLRDPNPSDLVRINQADQAYWSDIAHANVAHLVNVREHPWYGAKIRFVLSNKTPLYIVSTVDDWSEVMSDDRVVRGYVKSKYISVEKYQRVESNPLLK